MSKSARMSTLIKPPKVAWNPTDRRLLRAAGIADLRAVARRAVPRMVFDYCDGAADSERSLSRARETFANIEFQPSVLRDVSKLDTSRTVLGKRQKLPFALAPVGFNRVMHAEGEPAVASVAQQFGVPYSVSTLATTSLADVAAAAPEGRHWFQLYFAEDRAMVKELLALAEEARFDTILLTLDTPISVPRRRDIRNGLTIPPSMSVATFAEACLHPGWWVRQFRAGAPSPQVLKATGGSASDMIKRVFNPRLSIEDVEWLRGAWSGKLVAKGVQSVADAKRVAAVGVDGVWLSTHGGRKLDRAPVPVELLPHVVDEVGDRVEVLVDTGITSGADIVAAIALGASAAVVGRAYQYGLMAGGRRGVVRAMEILSREIEITMKLLGVGSMDELNRSHIKFR
ncbi:alpha-hydroxy acid oxidase [Micromonospora echinofusca]|uniref:L-lactate dehydrogenase (Cytochrome) n=1 Tax=Micromonospora echinofusca TaxID=47858 RepID=A0A1C5GDZ3_MICEH|nr:alpha-hydroxy acid oxidase [Micromonospora echinofusca]SCG18031.1 L-lactate dehydrogenase (cytochrome) [Micromonospora echinofusca]